jgi:hypothetical protein
VRELESRFPHEVAVVGVHSGKFIAERDTARIAAAAARLGVHHPVVNDRQFRVWRSYAVRAWPTLVVVDPNGYVVAQRAGEFTSDAVATFLERAIARADEAGALRRRVAAPDESRGGAPDESAGGAGEAPGALRFPGKVAVDGDRIAVADSGHHRVLVGRLTGGGRGMRVERVAGGPVPGMADGPAPRFANPQGLAFAGDTLFVADAGNHALRALDLRTGAARTVAGTGQQLRRRADLQAGALASPWDVTVVGDTLYVAMAGVHHLWAVDLATGAARPHSGSFREELADAPHAEAALAQPMGLAARDGRLWFVDAESSAVRWSDLAAGGAVGTVVGTGLFDFGDRDGAGDDVRLQHPQGIAAHPDGRLLIADSYNDALKWVDPATRRVETWVRGLHEPGGVALGGVGDGARDPLAYVADTNGHEIIAVADDGVARRVTMEWAPGAALPATRYSVEPPGSERR